MQGIYRRSAAVRGTAGTQGLLFTVADSAKKKRCRKRNKNPTLKYMSFLFPKHSKKFSEVSIPASVLLSGGNARGFAVRLGG